MQPFGLTLPFKTTHRTTTRKGDTGSDHLDPRDASRVPESLCGPDLPDSDPNQDPRHRVRVFDDFWSYTRFMSDADEAFRTD